MSVRTDIPELKRIQFFNGQRLSAGDLAELQRANRELRWLHNRSLHGWGIGIGYGVSGERGDTSVTIAPGYAIDCMGREIILTDPVTMTVPAIAGRSESGTVVPAVFYLTASYKEDLDQSVAERRNGVCVPAGTVRLSEGPLIAWREPQDITDGMDIILAQANVLNCQLDSALALGVRRSARPSQQPYIASGETVAASTIWTVKIENGLQVGVTTRVDTSAARFQAPPTYFSHVMGSRVVTLPTGLQQIALTLIAVSAPAPNGFNCDVYLPAGEDVPGGPQFLSAAEAATVLSSLQWSVVWMGVEG